MKHESMSLISKVFIAIAVVTISLSIVMFVEMAMAKINTGHIGDYQAQPGPGGVAFADVDMDGYQIIFDAGSAAAPNIIKRGTASGFFIGSSNEPGMSYLGSQKLGYVPATNSWYIPGVNVNIFSGGSIYSSTGCAKVGTPGFALPGHGEATGDTCFGDETMHKGTIWADLGMRVATNQWIIDSDGFVKYETEKTGLTSGVSANFLDISVADTPGHFGATLFYTLHAGNATDVQSRHGRLSISGIRTPAGTVICNAVNNVAAQSVIASAGTITGVFNCTAPGGGLARLDVTATSSLGALTVLELHYTMFIDHEYATAAL